MKVKVCGMRRLGQIEQLEKIGVDLLGFIFYSKSERYVGDLKPIESPEALIRVGVFVNEDFEQIQKIAKLWKLDYLQLHGEESVDYCKGLQAKGYRLIKVFGIKEAVSFEGVSAYEEVCDYFLFDTKGKKRGGNGYTFDWRLLKAYKGRKSYFLSGGIALGDEEVVLELAKEDDRLLGVDLNSRFEREAGDKNLEILRVFVEGVKSH